MSTIGSLATIASLVGEPARAAMLVTLMDGRALTAGELARAAGVTPPTASGHLSRLLDAGLLSLTLQGRNRYYRLSGTPVATMLEGMMALDASLANGAMRRTIVTGPRDAKLRHARVCYDHLAGTIAVELATAMVARGELDLGDDGAALTAKGRDRLSALGIELGDPSAVQGAHNSAFCRPCLDWSERKPHIAGAVGAALYRTFTDKHWILRNKTSRAVAITPLGAAELQRHFGVTEYNIKS